MNTPWKVVAHVNQTLNSKQAIRGNNMTLKKKNTSDEIIDGEEIHIHTSI